MKIEFNFSEPGSKTAEDCYQLLSQANNLGKNITSQLKSAIGGKDIGFHRYHQIYDVIAFMMEWKPPTLMMSAILQRGLEDKYFQRIFKANVMAWITILNTYDDHKFEENYGEQLNKLKKLKVDKTRKNDPNQIGKTFLDE